MPLPVTIDAPELITQGRAEFGDGFVSGRSRPEERARALLDASAGAMSLEQAAHLGEPLNEHT